MSEHTPLEEWKHVPGYSGRYLVSSFGRVISYARNNKNPIYMTPNTRPNGYKGVCLSLRTKEKFFFVHRLVTLAFIGEIPKNHQVNHKDGDKTNNHIDNLEYVTCKENVRHAYRLGLYPYSSRLNNAKLTAKDVLKIRHLRLTEKTPTRILAKMFNVHMDTITNVISRRCWNFNTQALNESE